MTEPELALNSGSLSLIMPGEKMGSVSQQADFAEFSASNAHDRLARFGL
jgi:hypothetical protein